MDRAVTPQNVFSSLNTVNNAGIMAVPNELSKVLAMLYASTDCARAHDEIGWG